MTAAFLPFAPAVDAATITECLALRARQRPDGLAYRYLETGDVDGPVTEWSWAQLHARAQAVAAALAAHVRPGDRVLLLFPPGLDFIAAFFGCLQVGAVAVPVPPPDPLRIAATLPRVLGVIADSSPRVVLTTSLVAALGKGLAAELAEVPWICVEQLAGGAPPATAIGGGDLAFLQYTSGSTGAPKGVRVSHANLIANLRMIERGYAITSMAASGHAVSWLPFYHDMGLIGVVLGTVYVGATATLMSPLDFLKRPARWLEAISRYQVATLSGAPDFAYAFAAQRCDVEQLARVELDLSNWRLAFSGAEPVRAATLERFAATFARFGFRRDAFRPSYGLAEATLFVSAGALRVGRFEPRSLERGVAREISDGDARELVSCGRPLGGRVRIVAPGGDAPVADGVIGEVLIAGDHASEGYWGTAAHPSFGVVLAGGDGPYVRTGDLGFLRDGELYLSGRLKDVIILRGRNLFPGDLEDACEGAHPAIRIGGVVAFGFDDGGSERIAVMIETRLDGNSADDIAAAVREAIAGRCGAEVHTVVLVPPRTILRTSSGKLRRAECRALWLAGELAPLAQSSAPLARRPEATPTARLGTRELVRWIVAWIQERVPGAVRPTDSFARAGLDSLNLVYLAGDLEKLLGFEIPVQTLYGGTIKTTASLLALGQRTQSGEARDLDAEATLPADITPRTGGAPAPLDGPLLVTGATGFLGSYLVEALLRRTTQPIVCLARAASDEAARLRVLDALAPFGLAGEQLSRVRGLAGDLARSDLGLGAARFAALADELAAIYHCGAEIDWIKPYSSLAPVNVAGTREVVRLACLGPRPLHHVSTIGVYPLAEDAALPFREDAPLGDSALLQLGYAQSKWVAEKLIEHARARGLPVTVYRPGFIAGDSRDGREQASEHLLLYAFLAGCIQLGEVPALDKIIEAAPVDWVADAIAAISRLPESSGRRLNLVNPAPLRQRDWYAMLRARGYALTEIAYPRWRERVLAVAADNPLSRFAVFYKLMDERRMARLERQLRDALPIEDAGGRALAAQAGLRCPPFDATLVATYLDYYIGRALLPRPDGHEPARWAGVGGARSPAVRMPDPFERTQPKLAVFYDRATRKQWRADDRLDWSITVDPENPAELPDHLLPLYGSPIYERATARERAALRVNYQAWQLSQALYGEQAAVVAAAQLVQTAPNTETQAFAAMQAADEARHIEIYTRLLDDKWGIHFAMAEPLTRLTDAVFRDGRWDVTSLGLQILVEGLALASFAIMRDQSRNPLIRAIHAYVMEDEARHVGFGHRLLAPYYAQLSDGERAEREEIVIESSYLLRDRLFAPESLWDHCGLPGERCAAWLRDSGLQRAQAAALFTRIIPAVRAIGLWSTRVQRAYGQLGLLELGVHELDHQRSDDERRAAAIERGDA